MQFEQCYKQITLAIVNLCFLIYFSTRQRKYWKEDLITIKSPCSSRTGGPLFPSEFALLDDTLWSPNKNLSSVWTCSNNICMAMDRYISSSLLSILKIRDALYNELACISSNFYIFTCTITSLKFNFQNLPDVNLMCKTTQ